LGEGGAGAGPGDGVYALEGETDEDGAKLAVLRHPMLDAHRIFEAVVDHRPRCPGVVETGARGGNRAFGQNTAPDSGQHRRVPALRFGQRHPREDDFQAVELDGFHIWFLHLQTSRLHNIDRNSQV
jgi:hypothetical protein